MRSLCIFSSNICIRLISMLQICYTSTTYFLVMEVRQKKKHIRILFYVHIKYYNSRCTLIAICAIESVQSVDNQFRERKTSGLAKKTELHSISLFYYLQDLQKQKKRERGRTKFFQMKTYYTTILVGHSTLCKTAQKNSSNDMKLHIFFVKSLLR